MTSSNGLRVENTEKCQVSYLTRVKSIKRAKKLPDGKMEIEMMHIRPPKEKSILQKDRQTQFSHKFGDISKDSKVLTSEMKDTIRPEDTARLQNLFPLPSENCESPIQLRFDPLTTHHLKMRYLKCGKRRRWRKGLLSITPS